MLFLGHIWKYVRFLAPLSAAPRVVLWRGLGSHLGVYETHSLNVFRKLRFVDEFLKLAKCRSNL
jgi:hypothetical protein